MFFNNIGDHSKLSTIRLWLPVSMMSFSYFCSNTTSISFVYSFLLSSFWWFVHGGTTFLFWSLLGTTTPTTPTTQQHNDVFLYIRKTTFYYLFMDVSNNIGDHSKLSTLRLWLPVSMMSNIGDHSKLSTLRLWLPVSMMSFSHFFVLKQRQFVLFIVELHFYFGHYWGNHAHTNNNKPTT
jgi:hypothetical protein